MALNKSFTASNGAVGSYWKLTKIDIDTQKKTGTLILSCFLDHDSASNADLALRKSPLSLLYFSIDESNFPFTDAAFTALIAASKPTGMVQTIAYDFIKAQNDPNLVGATDC